MFSKGKVWLVFIFIVIIMETVFHRLYKIVYNTLYCWYIDFIIALFDNWLVKNGFIFPNETFICYFFFVLLCFKLKFRHQNFELYYNYQLGINSFFVELLYFIFFHLFFFTFSFKRKYFITYFSSLIMSFINQFNNLQASISLNLILKIISEIFMINFLFTLMWKIIILKMLFDSRRMLYFN